MDADFEDSMLDDPWDNIYDDEEFPAWLQDDEPHIHDSHLQEPSTHPDFDAITSHLRMCEGIEEPLIQNILEHPWARPPLHGKRPIRAPHAKLIAAAKRMVRQPKDRTRHEGMRISEGAPTDPQERIQTYNEEVEALLERVRAGPPAIAVPPRLNRKWYHPQADISCTF